MTVRLRESPCNKQSGSCFNSGLKRTSVLSRMTTSASVSLASLSKITRIARDRCRVVSSSKRSESDRLMLITGQPWSA